VKVFHLFSVSALHLLLTFFGHAQSFSSLPQELPLSLGYLKCDGDLALGLSLPRISLPDGTELPLTISHELRKLGFATVESRFSLTSLNTRVYYSSETLVKWLAPGGGLFYLVKNNGIPDSAQQSCFVSYFSINGPLSVFASKAFTAVSDGEQRKIAILFKNWTLYYLCGALTAIRTPNHLFLKAEAAGPRVLKLSLNAKPLFALQLSDGNEPLSILTNDHLFTFQYTKHQLAFVLINGKPYASFLYNEHGLLRMFSIGPTAMDVFWARSSDYTHWRTLNGNPVAVAQVGPYYYRFCDTGSELILNESNRSESSRILTIPYIHNLPISAIKSD